MKKLIRSCVWTAVMLVFVSGLTAAQDTTTPPLLEMLANVPDSAESRTELYFEDQRAIESAYAPAEMPTDFADFEAVIDGLDEQSDVKPKAIWWQVFNFTSSSTTATYLREYATMPDVVGFDYFEIDRELNYGDPGKRTYHFEGHFDVEAVRAALTARGYERHNETAAEMWCVAEGCDGGERIDPANRNVANPFGGELGRQLPVLVSENRLISSVTLPVMEAHVQAMNGDVPSLADAPDYRAAVEALTADGVLVQAHFFGSQVLPLITPFGSSMTEAQNQALAQTILEDFEPLPPFSLMAFGDVVTDTEQIGRMVLVYDNGEAAKTAADLLPRRIAAYQSLMANKPMTDMLASLGVSEVKTEVTKGNGVYIVALSFPTAKATPEEIAAMWLRNPDPPAVTLPGYVYRLLVNMVMRLDIGWLNTMTREELEALAGE